MFGPEIEICCDDVGQSIVVIVEATDQHNNKSTCMTSVIVDDEIAPEIDEEAYRISPSAVNTH